MIFNFLAVPMLITGGTTISTITQAVTTIVTSAVTWVTSWANIIVETPLLLFFIVFGLVGFGISAIMRIMQKR